MVLGTLIFSLVAFAISWGVGKRGASADRGELSFLVLIITWGAMLYGMYIAL